MRCIAVVLATAAVFACTARNAPPRGTRSATAQGQSLFMAYCSDCHGVQAHGDGPRAAKLDQPPTDLTWIAQLNGGRFDADAVAAYVDGRKDVAAHGPRDMPVWARELDDRNRALGEELKLTPALIAQIVAYLETLQER